MMMDWLVGLATGAGGAVIGAMATNILTNRTIDSKLSQMKDLIHEVSKDKAVNTVDVHEQKFHQDSMYDYVEKQLKEHEDGCGVKVEKELFQLKTQLGHMENRQTKMAMKVAMLMNLMTKIAEKMDVHPDLNAIDEEVD
jgi:CRISPR/Cas system CSM-associated protein Csm2 small subunit